MPNPFVIATDSCADLPKEFLVENQIPCLSLSFTINDKTYSGIGNNTLDPAEFYSLMRAGSMPKTQQINPDQAETAFEEILKEGNDILFLAFSSGLSGSCNSCKIAATSLSEKYPQQKIIVIDTLAASLGEGLLVYYAVEMKKQGKTIDEIAEWVETHKLNLCHMFTVDDLFHLHRGGRVSKASAIIGSMLGIKPVLHVDNEGHLIPIGKVRGRKASLLALVDHMEKRIEGFENPIIFISHGDSWEDARFVAKEVEKRFGIKQNLIYYVSPVIGSHSGPGTVALFFLGKER